MQNTHICRNELIEELVQSDAEILTVLKKYSGDSEEENRAIESAALKHQKNLGRQARCAARAREAERQRVDTQAALARHVEDHGDLQAEEVEQAVHTAAE